MSIAVLGVNHRTAPLEVRERFAHALHEVPGALARVLEAGAAGGVLLSTCNRTEFYLAEPQESVPEAVWALRGGGLGGRGGGGGPRAQPARLAEGGPAPERATCPVSARRGCPVQGAG